MKYDNYNEFKYICISHDPNRINLSIVFKTSVLDLMIKYIINDNVFYVIFKKTKGSN